MAMPSEPESGPRMISTLSCSISLRAMRVAVAGVVSVLATTVSIFLPPAMLPACLSASSTLRMPSAPPAAKAPSVATRMPTLIVSLRDRCAGQHQRQGGSRPDNSLHAEFLPRIDDCPWLVRPRLSAPPVGLPRRFLHSSLQLAAPPTTSHRRETANCADILASAFLPAVGPSVPLHGAAASWSTKVGRCRR